MAFCSPAVLLNGGQTSRKPEKGAPAFFPRLPRVLFIFPRTQKKQAEVSLGLPFICRLRALAPSYLPPLARKRKVTIWARVQAAFGLRFVPSPCKIPA